MRRGALGSSPRSACSLIYWLTVLLLVFVPALPTTEGYERRPYDCARTCDTDYLRANSASARHLQRLLQVYDTTFFNQTCVPQTAEECELGAAHLDESGTQEREGVKSIVGSSSRSRSRSSPWDSVRVWRPAIHVFFHMGLSTYTDEVVEEIMTAMTLSGLLMEATSMTAGISGSGVLPQLPLKCAVAGAEVARTSEAITFVAMRRYLRSVMSGPNPQVDDVVLYLHTKGTFNRWAGSQDWRRFMLFADVWLWRWNLILLMHFQSMGANLWGTRMTSDPTYAFFHRHLSATYYAGSYWWSRQTYIQHTWIDVVSDSKLWTNVIRMLGECLLNTGLNSTKVNATWERRMGCMFQSGLWNHYTTEFPVSRYNDWSLYAQAAAIVWAHAGARGSEVLAPMERPYKDYCYICITCRAPKILKRTLPKSRKKGGRR